MTEKSKKSNGSITPSMERSRGMLKTNLEDRKSMISATSGGSSTLCGDSLSNRTLTSNLTTQSQVRGLVFDLYMKMIENL